MRTDLETVPRNTEIVFDKVRNLETLPNIQPSLDTATEIPQSLETVPEICDLYTVPGFHGHVTERPTELNLDLESSPVAVPFAGNSELNRFAQLTDDEFCEVKRDFTVRGTLRDARVFELFQFEKQVMDRTFIGFNDLSENATNASPNAANLQLSSASPTNASAALQTPTFDNFATPPHSWVEDCVDLSLYLESNQPISELSLETTHLSGGPPQITFDNNEPEPKGQGNNPFGYSNLAGNVSSEQPCEENAVELTSNDLLEEDTTQVNFAQVENCANLLQLAQTDAQNAARACYAVVDPECCDAAAECKQNEDANVCVGNEQRSIDEEGVLSEFLDMTSSLGISLPSEEITENLGMEVEEQEAPIMAPCESNQPIKNEQLPIIFIDLSQLVSTSCQPSTSTAGFHVNRVLPASSNTLSTCGPQLTAATGNELPEVSFSATRPAVVLPQKRLAVDPEVKYLKRRAQNNESCRKSRQARKQRFDFLISEKTRLESRNKHLRYEVERLERMAEQMRASMLKMMAA